MSSTSILAGATPTLSKEPEFLASSDANLKKILESIQAKIPTGPVGSGEGVTKAATERGCWAIDEGGNGDITIAVPANLESWADDFQAIAGVAAIKVLADNPKVRITFASEEWDPKQRLDSKNKNAMQYFAGVAFALNSATTSQGQDYSGNFGHGVAFITHLWASANGLEPWILKGKSATPAMLLTKTAWGTNLPAELRRLEALIRRAAKFLDLEKNIGKWAKSFSQLAGHGIKQSLPFTKVGIVTQDEVNWLLKTHPDCQKQFEKLKTDLSPEKVDFNRLKALPEENRKFAALCSGPTAIHESVTRGRFNVLNSQWGKREQARENKRPIGDRIRDMDVTLKLKVFHPIFLRGRAFSIQEDQVDHMYNNPVIYRAVLKQVDKFCNAELNTELREMARTWFEDVLNALKPMDQE